MNFKIKDKEASDERKTTFPYLIKWLCGIYKGEFQIRIPQKS